MKRLLFILMLACAMFAQANTDMRTWTFKDGESFRASLISYDKENETVILKDNDVTEGEYKLSELTDLDIEWLKKWRKIQDEMTIALVRVGGDFTHSQTAGEKPVDYYCYFPEKYKESAGRLPLLILFSPGGKGQRFLKRHIEAAEKVGFILVCPDVFRNHVSNASLAPLFDDLMMSIKEEIDYDVDRVFMGGSSGGAMRAYLYTAEFSGPWAGVYANGGWLGGKNFYDLPFELGLRVAMLNGHKDRAANRSAITDTEVLQTRLAVVKQFPFEGGHQLADVPTQIKAMSWLLAGSKYYEGFSEDRENLYDTFFVEDQQLIVSTEKAFKAAQNLFSKIDLVGLKKQDVLTLLGAPEKLNSFAEAADEVEDNSLVYVLHDGSQSDRWVIGFESGVVIKNAEKK